MKAFISDDDGERLNILLGQAGNKILAAGNKAIEGSKQFAEVAHEKIKQIQESKSDSDTTQEYTALDSICTACNANTAIGSTFCNHCGEKLRG